MRARSSRRTMLAIWATLAALAGPLISFAQQQSAGTASATMPPAHIELPVILRQKIVAGVTPAGTLVEAKLQLATLINGKVIPEGAILAGHVEQSQEKTGDAPSRLAIKFDSARWKKGGSASLRVYFSGCYYPMVPVSDRDRGLADASNPSIGRSDDETEVPRTLTPGAGLDQVPHGYSPEIPLPPATRVSPQWIRLAGAEAEAENDGGFAVTSKAHNLKLDKYTTYLLTDVPPITGPPPSNQSRPGHVR